MAKNKDGFEGGQFLSLSEQAELNRNAHEAKYGEKTQTGKGRKASKPAAESQVQQDSD